MKTYIFKGSVLDGFNRVIASGTWSSTATSQGKAANNIRYRINNEMGKLPSNRLILSGTWEER